jgi:hypothetical protein
MARIEDLFPGGVEVAAPAAAPKGDGLRTLKVPSPAAQVFTTKPSQFVSEVGPDDTWRSTRIMVESARMADEMDAPPPVDEQAAALEICRTAPFVNLSGTAGVGKTTVARQLAADEGVVLAATTGIASINLGEGTTINALLRYFDTDSLKEMHLHGMLAARLRSLRRTGTQTIVIDEKSMLNGDQLTYIVRAMDEINDTTSYDASLEADEDARPAGKALAPMRLILVGDFGQLPPVPDKDPVTQKNQGVKYAFDSPEWGRFAAQTVTLQQIRRQDSQPFIRALQAIRKGAKQEALEFFSAHGRFHGAMDDHFEGTTIFARNDAVERYNQLRLDVLTTPVRTHQAVRTGKQRGDWKLIPDQLTLKEGALVMILANRRVYADDEDEQGTLIYANGDLGVLRSTDQNLFTGWSIELQRGGVVQVLPITRHNLIPLEVGRRKELTQLYGAEGAKARIDGKKEIIGSVSYMPLRCAYGCTVHKVQGLTLDSVQVNLRDPFFRQPGMLFVAMSRARTMEGLRIIGDQRGFAERITLNQRVIPWL